MSGGFLRPAGRCRAYASSVLGHRSVVLENRLLRVVVLPERGGAVFELLWKPTDTDILWRWERGLRPAGYKPGLDLPQGGFQDHFFGGWDLMFPTVDRFEPVAPLPIGYHGEVAFLPWSWRMTADDPAEVALELTVRCVRAPFVATRTFRLSGDDPWLDVDTAIENVSAVPARYAVGEHIAFGVDHLVPGTLELKGATLTTADEEASPNVRLAPGQRSKWPSALLDDGTSGDASRLDERAVGTSDVVGLVELAEAAIKLVPDDGPLPPVRVSWDASLMPALLLWIGLGAETQAPWFGTARLLAVEPMSLLPWADPGSLPTAEPGAVTSGRVRVAVGDAAESR